MSPRLPCSRLIGMVWCGSVSESFKRFDSCGSEGGVEAGEEPDDHTDEGCGQDGVWL